MNDRQNRQRWAIDQKKRASAAFAAQLPSVKRERAERLAALHSMLAMMATMPHMARQLERVREQIAALS